MRLPIAVPHGVRDEAPDLLGRLDQVRVGKVGVAGGRAVSAKLAMSLRASARASGMVKASALPRVVNRLRPRVMRSRAKLRAPGRAVRLCN